MQGRYIIKVCRLGKGGARKTSRNDTLRFSPSGVFPIHRK